MIKKYLSLALLITLSVGADLLQAQNIELVPTAGYTFRNRAPIQGGEVEMQDGVTYGVNLRFEVRNNNYLEIFYSWQETFVTASSIYFNETFRSPGSFNYILVGTTQKVPFQDAIEGYGGFKIGAGWLTLDNSATESVKFSMGGTAGLNFFLSETIGLQIGMHLLFPVTNVGASFGWSSSGGTGVGVSTWSPIFQFGFNGGLVLRLGN